MHTHATAAILSIGDELVTGQTLDTNAAWLADHLLALGVRCVEHATVGDDRGPIAAALARLAGAAHLVIATGGLGPTADDNARHALADAMRDELVEDDEALAHLRRWYKGRVMPGPNLRQALRPRTAAMIRNDYGTAPALVGRIGDADVFCLPGPPRELTRIFEEQVMPRLRPPARTIAVRLIHAHGLGESDAAARLGDLLDRTRNPLVGITASGAILTCRARYEGPLEGASVTLEETERLIRHRLEPFVFGTADESLAGAVLGLLRTRGQTLAVVESCTGGGLGAMLTAVPGSSDVFVGGWITYSNDMKSREVGVSEATLRRHGAVSRECAGEMAAGGLRRAGADHCLAITGIAGPGGGTADKPAGTVWIARASRGAASAAGGSDSGAPISVDPRRFRFAADRETVRDRSAKAALSMLRLHLLGRGDTPLLWQAEPAPP